MALSILDLPAELLAIIFGRAIGSNILVFPGHRATLCLVSKAWCFAVFNTPSLWTTIAGEYPLALNSLALTRSRH